MCIHTVHNMNRHWYINIKSVSSYVSLTIHILRTKLYYCAPNASRESVLIVHDIYSYWHTQYLYMFCNIWIDIDTYISYVSLAMHFVCTLWMDIDTYVLYVSLSSHILCTLWIDIDTYISYLLLSVHILCTIRIKRSLFILCTM